MSVNIQTSDNKLHKIASVNASETKKTVITLSIKLTSANSPYHIAEKAVDLMLISNDGEEDINLYIGSSQTFTLKAGECISGLSGINVPLSVENTGTAEVPLRIIYTKETA